MIDYFTINRIVWLATNTDVITSQSPSLFACLREQIRLVENRLYVKSVNKRCAERRTRAPLWVR